MTGLKLFANKSTPQACSLNLYRAHLPQTAGFTMTRVEGARPMAGAIQCMLPHTLKNNITKTVKFSAKGWFVRGFNVCLAGGDTADRGIQGLKIWAAKVNKKTGVVTPLNDTAISQTDRCKQWQTKAFCPAGMVAYNSVAHYQGMNLSGLQLHCAPVVKYRSAHTWGSLISNGCKKTGNWIVDNDGVYKAYRAMGATNNRGYKQYKSEYCPCSNLTPRAGIYTHSQAMKCCADKTQCDIKP
jgi:hypothetical protein